MKKWTFLLQKDGDRSWLPLGSAAVAVAEGRYRIVAQTEHPNADISIRICHLATTEDPPKRRIQKRSNRTNRNGLMVVTPFTRLQPGDWEFSCFLTDPMSELIGDMVHQAVRLQVAPSAVAVAIAPPIPVDGVPVMAVGEQAAESAITESSESSLPVAITETAAAVERADAGMMPAVVGETDSQLAATNPAIATPSPRLGRAAAESNSDALPDESFPACEPFVVSHATSQVAAANLNVEIAQSLGVSMDRLVAMTDQLSHQLIEEIFREFNLPVVVEPATETADTVVDAIAPPEVARLDVRQVAIALAQDSWLAVNGESLAIAGELCQTDLMDENLAIADGLEVALEDAIPQELQVQFRDPQTSQVLFHAQQSFPQGALPFAFTFQCPVPEGLSTHLLLGEVLIVGTLPGAETAAITLKSVTFTVTVDPQGLVDELQKVKTALAATAEPDELPDAVMQFSSRLQREQHRPLLDLSFLNLAAPMPESAPQEMAESSPPAPQPVTAKPRSILPPQLYQPRAEQPSAEQPSKRKLELPVFAGASSRSQAVAIAEPPTTVAVADPVPPAVENAFNSSTAELQAMVVSDAIAPPAPSSYPLGFVPDDAPSNINATDTNPVDANATDANNATDLNRTVDAESFAELEALLHRVNLEPEQPQDPAEPTEPDVVPESMASGDRRAEDLARLDELTSPVRSAFQALNLQDKFLDRLSSLAGDAELATLLKLTLPTEAVQTEDTTETETPSDREEPRVAEPQVNPIPLEAVMAAPETTEVVVDDDPTWRAWVKRAGVRGQVTEPAIAPATATLILPADQAIPVPELDITPLELVAGKTMNLRVRLPNVLPKIYIKLWIHDRQTRTLLDGPRWLVDLSPNGFDELEATTQLLVPMGCLQIRLEAIAVEMHTQRESQKVGLDFDVMPPDLPEDPFAGFDL